MKETVAQKPCSVGTISSRTVWVLSALVQCGYYQLSCTVWVPSSRNLTPAPIPVAKPMFNVGSSSSTSGTSTPTLNCKAIERPAVLPAAVNDTHEVESDSVPASVQATVEGRTHRNKHDQRVGVSYPLCSHSSVASRLPASTPIDFA
jgi:hypothetical protein